MQMYEETKQQKSRERDKSVTKWQKSSFKMKKIGKMGSLHNRHHTKTKKIWNASRILRVILAQGPC